MMNHGKNEVPLEKLDERIEELERVKARKDEFEALSGRDKVVELVMERLMSPGRGFAPAPSAWGVSVPDFSNEADMIRIRKRVVEKVDELAMIIGSGDFEVLRDVLRSTGILHGEPGEDDEHMSRARRRWYRMRGMEM